MDVRRSRRVPERMERHGKSRPTRRNSLQRHLHSIRHSSKRRHDKHSRNRRIHTRSHRQLSLPAQPLRMGRSIHILRRQPAPLPAPRRSTLYPATPNNNHRIHPQHNRRASIRPHRILLLRRRLDALQIQPRNGLHVPNRHCPLRRQLYLHKLHLTNLHQRRKRSLHRRRLLRFLSMRSGGQQQPAICRGAVSQRWDERSGYQNGVCADRMQCVWVA